MDIQYNRVFSIVDIREEQLEKWGEVLPFYKNVREEGVVFVESSLRKLVGYRMERAKEMFSAAEGNLEIGQYKTS